MKINKSVITIAFVSILIVTITLFGILILSTNSAPTEKSDTQTVTVEGDKQIINITARGGYFPMEIEAQGGKETTLRVNTQNSFDCSTALAIPSLGVRENLPVTGKTNISLGTPKAGDEINGTCSMGMYSFKIKFI